MRINRYLAQCGVCSRRDADKLVEGGKVLVNGQVATMGQQIMPQDKVSVNGRLLSGAEEKVVLAFYKPRGVTCTERDPHAEKTLADLIDYPVRVTYAGRLDQDSEGLLLLTNDGALIDAMMRGANRHEKEYIVKTDREVTAAFVQGMSQGVYLKDLERTTRPCEVEKTGRSTFRIVLTQGWNRQIRRMCRTFGYEARSIKRVRVMNIRLEGIPYGGFREVTGGELEELYRLAGLARKPYGI